MTKHNDRGVLSVDYGHVTVPAWPNEEGRDRVVAAHLGGHGDIIALGWATGPDLRQVDGMVPAVAIDGGMVDEAHAADGSGIEVTAVGRILRIARPTIVRENVLRLNVTVKVIGIERHVGDDVVGARIDRRAPDQKRGPRALAGAPNRRPRGHCQTIDW
jgi:hypothetical protein